jgi:hypothetical protein
MQQVVVDHCWTVENVLIGICDLGRYWIFSKREGVPDLKQSKIMNVSDRTRLECVTGFRGGFIVGGSGGFIAIYEDSGEHKEKDSFVLTKTFNVGEKEWIYSISLSPDYSTACIQLKSNQVRQYSFKPTLIYT